MLLIGLLAIVIGVLLATAPGRRRPGVWGSGGGALDAAERAEVVEPADAAPALEEAAPVDEPDEPDEPAPPRELRLGDRYTRAEIAAIVGGGQRAMLPHVDGRVVGGCFHPGFHPYAPFVVLPGFVGGEQRWSRAFAAQDEPVPCFLKRTARAWEYVGDFRVAALSEEPDEVAEWARIAEREDDVSMVLHLEEVRGDDAA